MGRASLQWTSRQFSVKTSRPLNTGWDAIPRHFGKCAERYERKRDAAFLGRAVCAKCPDEYQKRALIGDARVIDISKSDGPPEVVLGVKQWASRCRDTKAHYNILVKLTPFETEDVLRKAFLTVLELLELLVARRKKKSKPAPLQDKGCGTPLTFCSTI